MGKYFIELFLQLYSCIETSLIRPLDNKKNRKKLNSTNTRLFLYFGFPRSSQKIFWWNIKLIVVVVVSLLLGIEN